MSLSYKIALTIGFASFIFLVSCNSTKSKQLAEQGVSQFHSQLDSEEYHALYVGSDDRLRQATSEGDFVALLQAVHRKLGSVQQANLRTFQVAWFAGQGEMVTLFYDTRFTGGRAVEKFAFHISDNHPLLVDYFINSNASVTK
jgi:hypothetical protein